MGEIVQKVKGHNNFYKQMFQEEKNIERYFNLYLYEPDEINEDTGILLLIAGFGGHSNSNIFKKMRKYFSIYFNLVVVQCDYFGYEFMQYEVKEESINNFCDMSFLQAMDNIYSVIYAINHCLDKTDRINAKKIIAYGYSQGGYLAHLCNIYSNSQLFTHILDNSGWTYPEFFRYKTRTINGLSWNYFGENIICSDNKFIDLEFLYKHIENKCEITSFHGKDDNIFSYLDKFNQIGNINNISIILIQKPDYEKFYSTGHGLEADFLKLFVFWYLNITFDKDFIFNFPKDITFNDGNIEFNIDYSNILPNLRLKYKNKRL